MVECPNLNPTCNPDGTGCRRTFTDDRGVGGRISDKNYLDLTFNYQPTFSFLQGLTINVGANNVTNTKAPLLPNNFIEPPFGNNNTFPGVFDFQGAQLFLGLTYALK